MVGHKIQIKLYRIGTYFRLYLYGFNFHKNIHMYYIAGTHVITVYFTDWTMKSATKQNSILKSE